jgi:UBX domain-containing protein 1
MSEQQDLIEQFVRVTSTSNYLAQQYLDRNNGDLIEAIEDFYANKTATTDETSDKKKKG